MVEPGGGGGNFGGSIQGGGGACFFKNINGWGGGGGGGGGSEFSELIPCFKATRGAWNELTKLSHHAEDAELIPTTTVPAPLCTLIMLSCGP